MGRETTYFARAYCSSYARKFDGLSAIYIVIRVAGKRKKIPLNYSIDPTHWDRQNRCVKSTAPNAAGVNLLIRQALAKINDIAINARLRGEKLTVDALAERYETTPGRSADFVEWMSAEMDRYTATLAPGTRTNHQSTLRKVQGCFPNGVPFNEFTHHAVEEFVRHLHLHNLNVNTRAGHLKRLKIYTGRALKENFLAADPFATTRAKYHKGDREALDREELDALEAFFEAGSMDATLMQSLRCFLFSCYTGLRIGDLRQVAAHRIFNDELRFVPEKTEALNKVVRVPLSARARRYLNRSRDDLRFDLPAEQTINRKLKIAARAVGIRKRLTFHVSRHTFATLFLQAGGSVEVLQSLLGHAEIATTMVYVHISDRRKREQIEKMSNQSL